MASDEIDNVDKGILYLLQENARANTTTHIAEQVGVSSSTVANRIQKLEDRDVITGFHPTVDYEKVGLDQHLLLIGSTDFENRTSLARSILDVPGVVSVQELLTNNRNVFIEMVGHSREYIESALEELHEIGVSIERIEMMKRELNQPFDHFGEEYTAGE